MKKTVIGLSICLGYFNLAGCSNHKANASASVKTSKSTQVSKIETKKQKDEPKKKK